MIFGLKTECQSLAVFQGILKNSNSWPKYFLSAKEAMSEPFGDAKDRTEKCEIAAEAAPMYRKSAGTRDQSAVFDRAKEVFPDSRHGPHSSNLYAAKSPNLKFAPVPKPLSP